MKLNLKKSSCLFFIGLVIFFLYFPLAKAQLNSSPNIAIELSAQGNIGPAAADYIIHGIKTAEEISARLVILKLDTAGGLSQSIGEVVKEIIASKVPVVTYVAPSGAQAARAAAFILSASHIAAMAPGTNLNTFTSDAILEVKALAALRDRQIKSAEMAAIPAKTLTANQALKLHVIDVVAPDVSSLLQQINGRSVKVNGETLKLDTTHLAIEKILPDWQNKFLKVITDPSIVYVLLLMSIYGLFFEFVNPGFVLPGVTGVICLFLIIYAFPLLPINYVGLGLMIFAIALMIAEAFVPSFGVLSVGGLIAFVIGSVILFDHAGAGFQIAWPVIIAVTVVSALFFLLVINLALKARFRPVVSGGEQLINMQAIVVKAAVGEILVRLHGEVWQAISDDQLKVGEKVRVISRNGLVLKVQLSGAD